MTGRGDRFSLDDGGETMMAVVTTGNGGYDKLEYREVPVPLPGLSSMGEPPPGHPIKSNIINKHKPANKIFFITVSF